MNQIREMARIFHVSESFSQSEEILNSFLSSQCEWTTLLIAIVSRRTTLKQKYDYIAKVTRYNAAVVVIFLFYHVAVSISGLVIRSRGFPMKSDRKVDDDTCEWQCRPNIKNITDHT